jgi:hypothetical protein
VTFSESVSKTLHIEAASGCGQLFAHNCNVASECTRGMDSEESGPAGQLIWNSFVRLHQLYKDYHNTLFEAGTTGTMLKDLEDKFASVPPEPDHT